MIQAAIKPFPAARQIAFYQLLAAARKTWLMDALSETLGQIDPRVLKSQLGALVPADVQKLLAASGVRDEHVFPAPVVLETTPTLVGYYRLLLGIPQKTFYGTGTGMGRLKSMETRGLLKATQKSLLPEFGKAMTAGLADLVRQVSPAITPQDVKELPLLTIGSQFQGGNNNVIGRQATIDVFLAIADICKGHIIKREERKLILHNAAGRTVIIALSSDPDVRIQEEFSGDLRNKVAIEIKGGLDKSNAHNRAGEAEKSHQKAKNQGFRDFWTVIVKRGLDMSKLKSESPTTTLWFDAAQVLGRNGEEWNAFRSRLIGEVGIPL